MSISTVLEAFMWLENRGAIESRPQSGFFVRVPFAKSVPEPRFQTPAPRPAVFGAGAIVAEVLRSATDPASIPLGTACPDPELLPHHKLNAILREQRCYLVEKDGSCWQVRQYPGQLTPPVRVEPDNPKYHREAFQILQ